MIVCLCKNISDRTIQQEIARGARCVDAVADACGAGTGCGSCIEDIELMISRGCAVAGQPLPACSLRGRGVLSPYLTAPAGEST